MQLRIPSLAALVALAFLRPSTLEAQAVKFLREPHVSNEGQLVFCYHGDIWISDLDGASPRRLTDHVGADQSPRFSPDGQHLAFSSNRNGNSDVFVIPSAGGTPKQLTHHSTGDSVLYWTPDGQRILIATSRGAAPWGSPLYTVDLEGHRPEPLGMDRGASGMIRQDGEWIAFNRGGFRYWRKHYRGNNNTDVWVQNLKSGEIRQLTDLDLKAFRQHTQDAHPMWGVDGKIYFMSERDGLFNLWRIGLDGEGLEQVTEHASDGIQSPSISPDGRRVVYENEFELWVVDLPDGSPRRIPVAMGFDAKLSTVSTKSTDSIEGFAPAPDGESVAVDVEGELFLVPSDPDFGEITQITSSDWRDRGADFSPDGSLLAYVSDASGEDELWLWDVATRTHRKLTTHASAKDSYLWSPDSTQIALVALNSLFLIDVAGGAMEEIAHNDEFGYRLGEFTPDGKWLLYSRMDADLDSEVYLFEIATKTETNLSQHPARDGSPRLPPAGSPLVFPSARAGEGNRLYAVSLSRLSEDPDDPLVRAAHRDEKGDKSGKKENGQKDEGEASSEESTDGEGDEDGAPALVLAPDLDGIDRRPRQISEGSESVSTVFLSRDGKKVYYVADGKLRSTDLLGREHSDLGEVSGRSVVPSGELGHVFFSSGGKLQRLPLKGGKAQEIPTDLRVRIDQRARWEQQFEESWRVMKYRFYDPNMHGFDWDAIKARYKPMLKYVGRNQDLYDLCNEMIGELNASHTGVNGPPTMEIEGGTRTRLPGFEIEAEGNHYRVQHVYRDGPADKEWLAISAGDYVLAIDGRPLRARDNPWPTLNTLLNDYVAVQVASPAANAAPGAPPHGEVRTLRIRTTGSLRNIKYEEWVHGNREKVDRLSGGKIGYVHIRSMNQSSLARFEAEIDRYWNKNGMVIDIRFNGGGNIDQQLIDILERRPFEYWNFRQGGRSFGRRPRQCIAGPQVMLINWRSASDSEVTPQAFRDLELGRIVGNPTYGAVIATGSYRLLGGASIRTPGSLVVTYDPSQPNNYGINLENFGVPPDVWVENTPADELAGHDRELEAAVSEALRMLAEGDWQYGEDD